MYGCMYEYVWLPTREAEEKKMKFQDELRKQIQSNKSKLLEQQREKQMTLEKNKVLNCYYHFEYWRTTISTHGYHQVELANYEMEKQQEEHKKELNFRNERSMRLGQIQERYVTTRCILGTISHNHIYLHII